MKIMILTYYWNSPKGGGINTHLKGLVNALKTSPEKMDITVGFVEGDGDEQYKIPSGKFFSVLKTASILRKARPNVINIRECRPLLFGSVLYRMFNKNARLIYTFHTDPSGGHGKKKPLFNWALNRCDYVTFIADGLERKVTEHYGLKIKTKKCVTHPGVTTRAVSDDEKTDFIHKYQIKKAPVILLQGFTATRQKKEGAIMLLQSFKRIKSKYRDATLLITREGAYSDELKQYAKKQGLEDVIFTGTLENPFVPLELCDIFAWPWLGRMGTGMALLEAMHAGKPIVATVAHGSLEPLTEGNSVLVKPDFESLARNIEKLLADKDLAARLGDNARKTVLRDFTWEAATSKHIKLYGGTIDER